MDNLEMENKELKEQLKKAYYLINQQKQVLNNFQLHDDAGTAYLYVGPNPKEVDEVLNLTPSLKEMTQLAHLERIINLLYEVDYHQQEVATGELAVQMHNLMMNLVKEFESARENITPTTER